MSAHNQKHIQIAYSLMGKLKIFLASHSDLGLDVISYPILEYKTELFDIVVREVRTENIKIVMNVCKTIDVMDYYNRLLIRQVIFPIDEIFVYDCQTDKWLGNNCAENSYSFILQNSLAEILNI